MGQSGSSGEVRTLSAEELSHQLAEKFATKCFTGLELYSFKDNFRSLAEVADDDTTGAPEGHHRRLYWTEDTLIRFLGLPEPLGVGVIVFAAASQLGAFPFPELGPAILGFEALVKVVALVTGRCRAVLRTGGERRRLRMWFRALAVYERRLDLKDEEEEQNRDAVVYDSDDGSEDLSLAALESLHAVEAYNRHPTPDRLRATIPRENLRRVVMMLLAFAPLEDSQPVADFAPRFLPASMEGLGRTADCVIAAFGDGDVGYGIFSKTVCAAMPFLFDQGLPQLFAHFLFSKNVDGHVPGTVDEEKRDRDPLLVGGERKTGILDLDLLAQLSLCVRGDRLWRRVRPLYVGSDDGFSMGSFETKVCKWNAPTILLVAGTLLASEPGNSRERAFAEVLPPRRHGVPNTNPLEDDRVVFAVFIATPWKLSHKHCFGDSDTLLMQLAPVHRVFRASKQSTDYAYFNKDDGFGFGVPPQGFKNSRRASPYFNIGPVSMVLDQGLEFGVFSHAGAGGAFLADEKLGRWESRFEIDEIEVWGCGGESEAEAQRRAWQWEEREALLRRQVNLGKDVEADRALLEMAGLIGQHQSGGSV